MNQTWGYLWLSSSHSEPASHFWPSSLLLPCTPPLTAQQSQSLSLWGHCQVSPENFSSLWLVSWLCSCPLLITLHPAARMIFWNKCTSHRPLRVSQWLLPHFQPLLGCSRNTSAQHQRSLGFPVQVSCFSCHRCPEGLLAPLGCRLALFPLLGRLSTLSTFKIISQSHILWGVFPTFVGSFWVSTIPVVTIYVLEAPTTPCSSGQ